MEKIKNYLKSTRYAGFSIRSAYTYITVKFTGRTTGIYCKNLICLISHHPPIMIELIGVHTPNIEFNPDKVMLIRYPLIDNMHGYCRYMFDSIKKTAQKPPFSLSTNYLDFGGVELQNDDSTRTLVTNLTNHLKEDIEVVWFNDNSNVFWLTPKTVIIPPNESVLYECHFRPTHPDRLYTKQLMACVYWTDFKQRLKQMKYIQTIDVPLNINLQVMGHSFPKNKVWLPLIELDPSVVILPPTTPMSPSYITMIIRASGHLPTSFKYIPPRSSNFILKPMQGIVNNFKIISVQLQPDAKNKRAYVERWGLELNNRTKDCLSIYLKGFCETVEVVIGTNNIVVFDTIYPGCRTSTMVPMKNTSIHFLKYNFKLEENSRFMIDHPQGEIASNETVFIKLYVTGQLEAPEKSEIRCEFQVLEDSKTIIGLGIHTFVTVYTKCVYSQLCALPYSYNFKEIEWGSKISTQFSIYNFGESPVHFKLELQNQETETDEVTLIPSTGTVKCKQNMQVLVSVKTRKLRTQKINIIYKVRLNSTSSILTDNNKHDIFCMTYYGVYPTLQIENICGYNFGLLFSKVTLWSMFSIDKLNHALRTTVHDETKIVEMFMPDSQISEKYFFANLEIQNKTPFATQFQLKREKLCKCKLIKKPKGLSFRKNVYECIHRDMLEFIMLDSIIKPNCSEKLRINARYLQLGPTKMMYQINLSHNRIIQIYIHINVLPEVVMSPSKYNNDYNFNLKTVFIGEKDPPAQVFPLYNNSSHKVTYAVDTTFLFRFNFHYKFDVFECLNPKGALAPFTSENIIFKFIPIEATTYSVSVPIKMGIDEHSLKLNGKGASRTRNYKVFCQLPCLIKNKFVEEPIELSNCHLLIGPLQVWSATERMLFIRNITADRIIGYSWQKCTANDVAVADTAYKKGVLGPKESRAVIIRINTLGLPCCLRLQMVCKLLDHTQHIEHKESVAAYNQKQKELEEQFTITEKGTFYAKNDVVILPKAEPFYVTVAIDICIISISDRNMHIIMEEQLRQIPQNSLQIEMTNIFTEYYESTLKESHIPQNIPNTSKVGKLDEKNVKLFIAVMEQLILDALLSKMFNKAIDVGYTVPQPYYKQFISNEEKLPVYVDQMQIQQFNEKSLQRHVRLIKHYLNTPDMSVLANVFQEVMTDLIHKMFELDPQIKNKSIDKQFIYKLVKSKIRHSTCTCDQ